MQVRLVCGSVSSVHSALVTLVQLLRVFKDPDDETRPPALPPIIIIDSPSMNSRGFMLDVSPFARVPTLVRTYFVCI